MLSSLKMQSMIIAIQNPSVFVGLSLDDARSQIAGYGYSSRVTFANGRVLAHVKDYDPLRITLKLDKNRVTEAVIG